MQIEYIVVHCSATPPSMDIGAAEIDTWHRKRGFRRIGYQDVIRRNGIIEAGRPHSVPGAHTLGLNSKSIGVCLIGGVSQDDRHTAEDNFTEAQFISLNVYLKTLMLDYPQAQIIGHGNAIAEGLARGGPKACPSFDVAAFLEGRGWVNTFAHHYQPPAS